MRLPYLPPVALLVLGSIMYYADATTQECGDGRLEALSGADADMCPSVSSQTARQTDADAEECDVSNTATFGVFDGACGTDCKRVNQVVELTTSAASADRKKQLIYGVSTDTMSNFAFDPYASSGTPAAERGILNPCLYSNVLLKANGVEGATWDEAVSCGITPQMRTEYTSLANCYHSDTTVGFDKDEFGKRKQSSDNDDNFDLYGHKCQWPAEIEISNATSGVQSWDPVTVTQGVLTDSSGTGTFPSFYPLCFKINDPSWPSVLPSSNEFVPQMTRMQYEVICDPLDQEEAYPDDEGNCEEYGDTDDTDGGYRGQPGQKSHKCTRLGNRKNPCSTVDKLFELYTCSNTECQSLEGLSSEYSNRYFPNDYKGVKYSFEHDASDNKNRFQCQKKEFNNLNLTSAGFILGDSTEAANKYICSTGGQETPCEDGEIVHQVDTCGMDNTGFAENLALKNRISTEKWKDLSSVDADSIQNKKFGDTVDAADYEDVPGAGVDCTDSTNIDTENCEVYKFYRDLQTFPTGCERKLMMRVRKGVSGQVMLRVMVRNFNTAVYEADADKGYVYFTSSMLPVSIEAKVKPLSLTIPQGSTFSTDNLPGTGDDKIDEKSFGDVIRKSDSASPFANMDIAYDHLQTDEAVRMSKYSRSTRTHLEVIECTDYKPNAIAIEVDKAVPRFRLATDAAFSGTGFAGDYGYYGVAFNGQSNTSHRIYELNTDHSYNAPTIQQMRDMIPGLTLRSKADFTANGPWWIAADPNMDAAKIDSYHEGYSTNAGLCLINRLYVFEPSSCDFSVVDSEPYYVNALPKNDDGAPTVSFKQETYVWDEDVTVPLKISVDHTNKTDDSRLWYFSHIEIEDLNAGIDNDQNNGNNFDLFSYGNTVGDSDVTHYSDTVVDQPGITRGADGKWRSFANKCTRWIYENGAANHGGFMSDELVRDGFASAEACLEDARQTEEKIWGSEQSTEKKGVFLRPYRKMTKNLHLKVTVYMYDGDWKGWHAGIMATNVLEQTSDAEIRLLHVPAVTRYDQEEILQPGLTLDENTTEAITFNQAPTRSEGIGLPLPYRSDLSICTYIKVGNNGETDVDEFHTSTDRDNQCDPLGSPPDAQDVQGGSTCAGGKCFEDKSSLVDASIGCTPKLGYKIKCDSTGADQDRATIETLVFFDESEGASPSGDPSYVSYNDKSEPWGLNSMDQNMNMPERISYQPSGNNSMASEGQWYRIEGCENDDSVTSVYWCNDDNVAGYDSVTDGSHSTICNILEKGEAADAAGSPGSPAFPLQNSLSINPDNSILADANVMGFSRNFWIVERKDADTTKYMPTGSLCMRGRSDFNTEAGERNSPVNLRLIAVMLDQVTAHADLGGIGQGGQIYKARSKSNTDQGAFSVAVVSDRTNQLMVSSLEDHMWSGATLESRLGYDSKVSFIEERNDYAREHVAAANTWEDIDGLVTGTLADDIDCGKTNHSDIMCMDRLRYMEQSKFHDQSTGRIQVTGYMQKTCGPEKMDDWEPAGGLFDVYFQYRDEYFTPSTPGHGFDYNDGAGYRVSDSHERTCVQGGSGQDSTCDIVTQAFGSDTLRNSDIRAGGVGGSICQIMLGANASVRNTPCVMRANQDTVGTNTETWSEITLSRIVDHKCHKASAPPHDCPVDANGNVLALTAREIASNLRFRLPEKWSNCVRFRFDVEVGNNDRDARPTWRNTFGVVVAGTTTNFKSDLISVFVDPQQRAEEPIMWIETNLASPSTCLGSQAANCVGQNGTQAKGSLAADYTEIDKFTNLNENRAMTEIELVAGYRSQIRVLAASGATDNETEHGSMPYPLQNTAGYDWDDLRDSLKVSEETVYLTVESKYAQMTEGDKPNQRFCLWLCPEGMQTCAKSQLKRILALDEDDDFTTSNVNCQPCDSDDQSDECIDYGIDSDGNPLKCKDPFGRPGESEQELIGCPTYSDSGGGLYHNPASKYSFKCTKAGFCPELKSLFISYPAEQVEDDVLEFGLWSRADWQGSYGYRSTKLSMNVLMKPSITLSEVGFGTLNVTDCDPDTAGVCDSGLYGAPLQPEQYVTTTPTSYIVRLHESKLHGNPATDGCVALNSEPSLSTKGSNHTVQRECGMRLPVSFVDSSLQAVAPVGIKFSIRSKQDGGISAPQLAQSLQMLCGEYALDSVGATSGDCVGKFVAMSGGDDDHLLRFQDVADMDDVSSARIVASGNYNPSEFPANKLSWNVGEFMTNKEAVVFGSDSTPWSSTDYSFNNKKCEPDRFFDIDLEPQSGYSPAVVAPTRASIEVRVTDDDFYGKVELAGLDGEFLKPLADLDPSAQSHSIDSNVWNQDDSAGSDRPFSAYVMRSRRASESDHPDKRAVGMQAVDTYVKIDPGTMSPQEYRVVVHQIHGQYDQNLVDNAHTYSGIQLADAGNLIKIHMIASRDDDQECKGCDVADAACYYYNCAKTAGDPAADIPFQWFRIMVFPVGPPSSCTVGGSKVVKFSIEEVRYTADAGNLEGDSIDCGGSNARNPNEDPSLEFTETIVISTEDAQDSAPFRFDFAGLDPGTSTGAEGAKEAPLAWNAGIDGSYIGIDETEHSQCAANNNHFSCAPREFKMHLCAPLRDMSWSTWNGVTSSFYTSIKDSANEWSQIGSLFDLDCPTQSEIDGINGALNGLTFECLKMSTKTVGEVTQTGVVCGNTQHPDYPHADNVTMFCGDDVPKRLLWKVTNILKEGKNVLNCPSDGSGSWDNIPFLTFRNKDDDGLINLSRRPQLCLTNGAIPDNMVQNPTETQTCSVFGAPDADGDYASERCIDLRVQDDEMFHQDNTKLDADITTMEAEFGPPRWDSDAGRLEISINNRYYHSPQEKTLVNVQLGECEPESDKDIDEFWAQHLGSQNTNPITGDPANSIPGAFGDCDFLDASNMGAADLSNAEMFERLFGDASAQADASRYDSGPLFGFTADPGQHNVLFTQERALGAGGSWTYEPVSVEDHGSDKLGTKGFSAKLSVSLERLQRCADRTGQDIVTISTANSNTLYKFTISSTHVSAKRTGDSTYAHYSPRCTSREYTLSVSNSMFALSGLSSNAKNNAIYVDSMNYVSGGCSGNCNPNVGPQHDCPDSAVPAFNSFDQNTLKAMQYKVNLDMRTVVNRFLTDVETEAYTDVSMYYGLVNAADVEVNANNCYGAHATAVSSGVDSGDGDDDVTRTQITFRTACMELRTHDGTAFGLPVADAFATCTVPDLNNPSENTDFSFRVRLWECANEASLTDGTLTGCQQLPDWLHVSVGIAFTENPTSVEYEVKFEKLMRFYRSHDHRDSTGAYPANAQDAATWRRKNILYATEQNPTVTYPVDSMLTTSLGFVEGSALEATMTTTIKDVRLCRFKKHCHHSVVSPAATVTSPLCTFQSMLIDKTHSPFGHHAANAVLKDGDKGCTEDGTKRACPVVTFGATAVPRLTCKRSLWEDFALSEAQYYVANKESEFLNALSDGSGKSLSVALLAYAFDPTIETMLMVKDGATTTIAESIHGSCEKNADILPVGSKETVGIAGKEVDIRHIFPKAADDNSAAGSCTCKGQRAYNFESAEGSGVYPYRDSGTRKVVYTPAEYSSDINNPANLHKCTWQNAPQHSDNNTPLNSVDQFTMSLGRLQRDQTYYFEISAVQYDHKAFIDNGVGSEDQFITAGGARRLLHVGNRRGDIPAAGIQQRAAKHTKALKSDASRKMLTLLLPVSDVVHTDAIFPQGKVQLGAQSFEGKFDSSATGGFVIAGPPVGHQESKEEVAQHIDEHVDEPFEWMYHVSFKGITQTVNSIKLIFTDSKDSSVGFSETMSIKRSFDWSFITQSEHIRVSIGMMPWVILLAILFEIIVYNMTTPMALMSTKIQTVSRGFFEGRNPTASGAAHLTGIGMSNHFRIFHRYSRGFFDYPGSGVDLGRMCNNNGGGCLGGVKNVLTSSFAILISELGAIMGGYYIIAIVLYVYAIIPMVPILVIIHMCDSTKVFRSMYTRFSWYMLDYSCTEIFWYLTGANNKGDEVFSLGTKGEKAQFQKGSARCKVQAKQFEGHKCSSWMILLVMMMVRGATYMISFAFLPMSIWAAVFYYAYTTVTRMSLWMCCATRLFKNASDDYFFGHTRKMFSENDKKAGTVGDSEHADTHSMWTLMPWEWRGIGYGYLEFGKLDELETNAGQAELYSRSTNQIFAANNILDGRNNKLFSASKVDRYEDRKNEEQKLFNNV
jgi:hypothetical protein